MSELPLTKKHLGQHWLTDLPSLEYICELANVTANDTVLEVGPGAGTLTEVLAKKAGKVIAVEYDQQLALPLAARFAGSNVQIVPDDILQFDTTQLPQKYKVVANIPYYLTSHLLRRLLESTNPPHSLTLLVQKEVAERIAAKPGKMSVLSVSVQFYCQVELGDVVPAAMFTPPPKVDSQVIKLTYRATPLFKDVDAKVFFKLVKAGFSERRKKLRSSLAGGLQINKPEAEKLLDRASISPDARAQELSLDEWNALSKVWTKYR